MTPFETDHIIAARAFDGNNFNLTSDFLRQNQDLTSLALT
jgi:hypothetical protein